MGIRFACHNCQKSLNIKSELAGKRGVCPQCGARFRIPAQDGGDSLPVEPDTSAAQTVPAQGSAAVTQGPSTTATRRPVTETVEQSGEPKALPIGGAATAPARPVQGAEMNIPDAAGYVPTTVSRPTDRPVATMPSLLNDLNAVWYVRPPSGGQYGPATGDMIKQWISEMRVTSTTLIWRDGWPQWRSAGEALIELGGAVATATAAQPVREMSHSTSASSAVAPALHGDATIGSRKSRMTNHRILVISGLTALSLTLVCVLIYLIRQS